MSSNLHNIGHDLYQVLEIDDGSDPQQIKKAYKRLAIKYHPDRPTGDKKKFQQIAFAYEVLSDTNKRREYDLIRISKKTYSQNQNNQNNQHQSSYSQSNQTNMFYQNFVSPEFDPFSIFTQVFGSVFDYVRNNDNPLTGTVFVGFPDIKSFKLGDTDFLDDLDVLEEFFAMNDYFEGDFDPITMKYPERVQSRHLGPIFQTAQKAVNFMHGEMNHDETLNLGREEPVDLVQNININLLDVYQNKTKKFKLARIRFTEESGQTYTDTTTVEIPLIYKQLRLDKEGDHYPNWKTAGDLVINLYINDNDSRQEQQKQYKRVNEHDLFSYLKVSFQDLTEKKPKYFQLVDGQWAKLNLSDIQLENNNNFIAIENYGLPKNISEKDNSRGVLYLQLIPTLENDADKSINNRMNRDNCLELTVNPSNLITILDLEYDEKQDLE